MMKRGIIVSLLVLIFSFGGQAGSNGFFSDVGESHRQYTPIIFFAEQGIIHGYGDSSVFGPSRMLNRAEAAKIIFLTTQSYPTVPANCYNDVFSDQWFSQYVCWSYFINGYGDGDFRPANPVNLGEALKMMYVAFTGGFPMHNPNIDGPWYAETVSAAKNMKIVHPNASGAELISRGDFIELLYRFYTIYKDPDLIETASLPAPEMPEIPISDSGSKKKVGSGGYGSEWGDEPVVQPPVVEPPVVEPPVVQPPVVEPPVVQPPVVEPPVVEPPVVQPPVVEPPVVEPPVVEPPVVEPPVVQPPVVEWPTEPSLEYSQRFRDAFVAGLAFFMEDLTDDRGAIRSNLTDGWEPSDVVGVGDDILSESYGLIFNALANAGPDYEDEFQFYYEFFDTSLYDHGSRLVPWRLWGNLEVDDRANAMIDDLRIIKGLLAGYDAFGNSEYLETALEIAEAIKEYGTEDDIFVEYVGWNENDTSYYPADSLRLGYADVATARELANYDPDWALIADATETVLINAQFDSGLFEEEWNFETDAYETDGDVQGIFQAYIGEYLAESGETAASQRMLDFFKHEWEENDEIRSGYETDGTPSSGHQNIAVYSEIARMAYYLGDREFAEEIGDRLVSLLLDIPDSDYDGAFAWSEGERIYSFNQGNALQTLALLGWTPSLPPTPPPTLEEGQFAIWHAADVLYRVSDLEMWGAMVDDMNDVPYNYGIIAGDIAGDGSVENFNAFLEGLAMSNHPREDFHIIAGNHEHLRDDCDGVECLVNFIELVSSQLYYSWDYGNVHFIMVSTDCERWRVCDGTMDWVRNELEATQDTMITVVVTHHMPHVDGFEHYQEILDDPAYQVDFALFGHAHCQHGSDDCTRHGALGDFYQIGETTFVDAGYVGNHESRYLLFTDGSDEVVVMSRNYEDHRFQDEYEHTVNVRHAFEMPEE